MAFTPDGIAPPGIPLLGCSPPPHHDEVQNGLWGRKEIIICKIEVLLNKYRNICRHKNRVGSAQQAKKDDFVASCNLLFYDILLFDDFHAMNLLKIKGS